MTVTACSASEPVGTVSANATVVAVISSGSTADVLLELLLPLLELGLFLLFLLAE